MSSLCRMRLVSLANISSRRFFSRMTVWDFWGFDQRLGSEARFSISVKRWRRLPASKILPKFANFIFQDCIFFFKFFNHEFFLLLFLRDTSCSPPQPYCHPERSEGSRFSVPPAKPRFLVAALLGMTREYGPRLPCCVSSTGFRFTADKPHQ